MRDYAVTFYSELYEAEPCCQESRADLLERIPRLSSEERASLDNDLSLEELTVAVKQMAIAENHAHRGTYSCVYHVNVFSQNFSSTSPPLRLRVSGSGLWTEPPAVSSAEVRLVEGAGRCDGRVERKTEGNWESVDDRNHDWNLTSAAAVCRQLDCGSVVSLRRTLSSHRPDELTSQLIPHNYDVYFYNPTSSPQMEIICSDSVRLVNGSGRCSGRLEVKSNQSWSSVSQDAFDQQDAEVVCRELDCGAPSVLQGALYGDPEAPVWSREFNCEGHESTLQDCDSSVRKYSGKAVEVTCSEPEDLRLVGGSSRCGGTLELKQWGEWKAVFMDHWILQFSAEVCRQLNCGTPISIKRKKTSQRLVWMFKPDCDEPNLTNCFTTPQHSSDSTSITCSDSVRLVNGPNWCSGRLEVKSNQLWSSVCEDDFDQQDAEVVCQELDCGAPSVLQGALYGESVAPTWSRTFNCEGHESSLLDCDSSGPTRDTCPPGKAVGLNCSDTVGVRLVGGANGCNGQLEVKHRGVWRPAYDINSEWSLKIKSMIRECLMIKDAFDSSRVEITCSASTGPVRLMDGPDRCSGRLEVKSNQLWSSVCEDDFDQQDAEVVCKELGCGAPSGLQGALYGEPVAPV
ncbi:scavenger receptor cysteine-rich type 1 protein M130-like, partial [Xenentodon cancila]